MLVENARPEAGMRRKTPFWAMVVIGPHGDAKTAADPLLLPASKVTSPLSLRAGPLAVDIPIARRAGS